MPIIKEAPRSLLSVKRRLCDHCRMDNPTVTSILPHRYPFLLVDRVVEISAGKRIVALKNVTINEPFFTGHFPDHPLMPGVLICEAVVQAGGILACSASGPAEETPTTSQLLAPSQDRLAMLTGLDRVRFRRQVVPGDQLLMEVEILRRRGTFWKMQGTARVEGQLAAELEFTVVDVDPESETPA